MATLLELQARLAKASVPKAQVQKAQVQKAQVQKAQVQKIQARKARAQKAHVSTTKVKPDFSWVAGAPGNDAPGNGESLRVRPTDEWFPPGNSNNSARLWAWERGFIFGNTFHVMSLKEWKQGWSGGDYASEEDVDGHGWAGFILWGDDHPGNVFWFATKDGAKRGMESLASMFLADPGLYRKDAQRAFSGVLHGRHTSSMTQERRPSMAQEWRSSAGGLVDVSKYAMVAGFTMPAFMTRAAYARTIKMPPAVVEMDLQSESGRAWDVFTQLLFVSKRRKSIPFQVYVNNSVGDEAELVDLVAVFNSETCTIMLSGEES